jgi:hypothetical protein
MSDDELLTMLQEHCFRYYWEQGSHPVSGTTRENMPGDRFVEPGEPVIDMPDELQGKSGGYEIGERTIDGLISSALVKTAQSGGW